MKQIDNKVKLFEVSINTKTNDIHVVFENSMLELLKVDKENFYEQVNKNKGLEKEIRKICETLIESAEDES